VRTAFTVAIDGASSAGPIDVPAVIAGELVHTAATIDSVDPSDVRRLIARSASCTSTDADAAVAAALAAAGKWRSTPAPDRAALLFRTAAQLRARRNEIAALEVFEAGKPWDQADADVCEAIDFCEYYGREMLRLDSSSAERVQSPPGESHRGTFRSPSRAA
jgi:RHH-type proline utilization regulon transcriptional repressor/proline dehydrogenase/delta 1-pyrroline-5-carboxylate dehydrogenase